MMIGPYPVSPDKIDGGVAAATMYLSQDLSSLQGVELIGVRIARKCDELREDYSLGWLVVDMPLGRFSLSTLYRPQRRRLSDLIERYDPDVVHAQGTDLAGLLAVTCGRPAVVTVHGILGECARFQTDPTNRLRASLAALVTERRTIRRAPDLIAISPYVARYYREDIKGRVHDIPNPVAPSFFSVVRRMERGRFLYAGRIANGKGLVELLQAVARNTSAVAALVLAGATPDPAYGVHLRGEVERLGLGNRVHFAGLLTEPELVDEFARAEALVLPSHQETAPMVVQQAMAAGLAVIATTVGGIPGQIQHEVTGLLFEAGDVLALSELMQRLGNNPGLSGRLGQAAKAIARKKFLGSAVAEATLSVYRTALGLAGRHAS
jgi:glycosyltransferase involved in cell wall biosynthesis